MNYYLGLGAYSDESLTEVIEYHCFQGLILGDLFCQRRMFENGEWGIPKYAEIIKQQGLQVILQTPMYLTPESLDRCVRLISYLLQSKVLDAVLLQDIGLLNILAKKYPALTLCWSRMGKGRGGMISLQFVELLHKLGVSAMELDSKVRAEAAIEIGMGVWQIYGNLKYKTLWRECYTCYQLEIEPENCGCSCETPLELVSNQLKMTVNGHVLGEKIEYPQNIVQAWDNSERMVIYAKTITNLKGVKLFDFCGNTSVE